jgi:ADP-ribose pyrophosphatase YjhB (NUDIX family)
MGENYMSATQKVGIQLTANVIIISADRKVLLTRYDEDDERMWIPDASLNEYEHPDAAANRAVADVGVMTNATLTLNHIESFRGRRGWHVMFNYLVRIDATTESKNAIWYDAMNLPQTAHGEWEKGVIVKALMAAD